MRLPRVLDRRRRRYEELVTQHLDGVLDAAGEARLREVLDAAPALAAEVREREAVTALVRAEPLGEPPRSFALPYAPARLPAPPRSGALPWMQAATATAALLLVTLIGVDLVVAPIGGPQAPESTAVTAEGAPAAAEAAAPPPDAPAIDSASGAGIQQAEAEVTPPEALQAAAPPSDKADADTGDAGIPRAEAEVQDRSLARGPEPGPAPIAGPAPAAGRSALDWAQLGLGAVTALLAMGVALLSWRAARRRA